MFYRLILCLILSFTAFAQNLELESFVRQVNLRQSKVEEFQFIKKTAKLLGIKNIYMFGGTAAAWAHYVRWDMRRELGLEKLQAQRFDYDYTNIFRANQDFDIVIDGTVAQASELEKIVQQKFAYFSGPRPTWEVRLLNEARHDKDPIMGLDFQNQHTDSHSTGLIEMLDCQGYDCIKDVRDMGNNHSQFLMDVFEARLRYYFSDQHTETSRYKLGMNPEILSVVRYFTKAVQYELKQRPEDIKIISKIIKNFKPEDRKSWDSYVLRWLDKNAKKLIINAVDMEYAQKLIERSKLKEKLIALSDPKVKNSMSWWLNKKALQTFSLGTNGKTANELFGRDGKDIVVSHETDSFEAYESITKAHDGSANVLVSRENVVGEAAAYGEGHYTRIGRIGAAGTGLTIRYKLNPLAVEGQDFIQEGEYIVVKNKAALEVIPESIEMTAYEYFRRLNQGLTFDFNDNGVKEKLTRKIKRKLGRLTLNEIEKISSIPRLDKNKVYSEAYVQAWKEYVVPAFLKTKYKNMENVEVIDGFPSITIQNSQLLEVIQKKVTSTFKKHLKDKKLSSLALFKFYAKIAAISVPAAITSGITVLFHESNKVAMATGMLTPLVGLAAVVSSFSAIEYYSQYRRELRNLKGSIEDTLFYNDISKVLNDKPLVNSTEFKNSHYQIENISFSDRENFKINKVGGYIEIPGNYMVDMVISIEEKQIKVSLKPSFRNKNTWYELKDINESFDKYLKLLKCSLNYTST